MIALAWVPSASMQGDDAVRIDVPGERRERRRHRRGAWPRHHRRPVTVSFYRLHYGAGASPSSSRPVGSAGDPPVENGVLGIWDTAPLFQGEYLLQLTVYDTSGDTTTAQVVVNVLPAPTPTPRNQPAFIVPVPGETPEAPEEDTGPTPTPLPELPQLDPQIPYIEVPQQDPGQPPIQQVNPPPPEPGFQPIQIDLRAAAGAARPAPGRAAAGLGPAVRSRSAARTSAAGTVQSSQPGRTAAGPGDRAVRAATGPAAPPTPTLFGLPP